MTFLATLETVQARDAVLLDIDEERWEQDAKWGQQNHPDGTGNEGDLYAADQARTICQLRFDRGVGTWRDILNEEIAEAYAENGTIALRKELVQCAAVIVAWIEDIDRRG